MQGKGKKRKKKVSKEKKERSVFQPFSTLVRYPATGYQAPRRFLLTDEWMDGWTGSDFYFLVLFFSQKLLHILS